MSMTTTPYRSGGREDIDDEGFLEPLMVKNMACCAKELWDLKGSIDLISQIGKFIQQERPKVDQTTYEENEEGHNRLEFYEMAVRTQWDRAVERIDSARDWCYMPELPENPDFFTGDSPNPSFYTLNEIVESADLLERLVGHLDSPNNAINRAIKRGNC